VARPRTHDEKLRLRLLDEGGRLLAEEGPAALTVRRLAERAGTSPSAVYSLFGDKWGLVEEMFREGFRRFAERIAALKPSDDPVADLDALGAAYRANGRANPHLYDLMFGQPFPQFQPREEVGALAMGTFGALVEAVGRCVDAGLLEGDSFTLAAIFYSLIDGLTGLELIGWLGSPERADEIWARAEAALFRGLTEVTAGAGAATRS
jgi:AcrR family transcriptional regulator